MTSTLSLEGSEQPSALLSIAHCSLGEEALGLAAGNSCKRLPRLEVIRFLGYKKLREIDESLKHATEFDTNVLLAA